MYSSARTVPLRAAGLVERTLRRRRGGGRGRRRRRRTPTPRTALTSSAVSRAAAAADDDDEVYRVMSRNQELSVIAVRATKLVSEAQRRHRAAPTATAAIGRNVIASLLLGAFKGDEETVQITFKGEAEVY